MRKPGIDAQRLLDVNAQLGDVAVDPSLWPDVMAQICAAVGATGAALLQGDSRTPDVPRTEAVNELFENYFQNNWHLRDFREKGIPLLLSGRAVFRDQDVSTPEEMAGHPYYQEAIVPFGFKWFAGIGFWAGAGLWCLAIQRTPRQGPFENEDARLLATLSSRLSEVATLSTAVGRIALSSATEALNVVHQPAIAIDRLGFVLNINMAAEGLFGSELYIKNGRLFSADPEAKRSLETLLDRLRVATDAAPLPAEPIIVRRREQAPVLVRMLPVHPAARGPFLGARALLTFTSLEAKPALGLPLLAKAFGLTPAEGRLAALMAQGLSPEQAAEQLGIARVTARNQLRAAFAKTGTHRQSELVALLARL